MAFTFRCPHCDTEQSATEQVAGRSIRCPGCDKVVTLPEPTAADSAKSKPAAGKSKQAAAAAAPAAASRPAPTVAPVSFRDENLRPSRESEMDMTPMVDVTFLLLIFFMVTAAFTLQKSIEVPKPENTDQPSTTVVEEEEESPDLVTVHVDEYNTFHVITVEDEFECPSQQELLVRLRQAMNSDPKPTRMIVRANGEAIHARVVMALDAGAAVGLEDVQLMTVDEDFF